MDFAIKSKTQKLLNFIFRYHLPQIFLPYFSLTPKTNQTLCHQPGIILLSHPWLLVYHLVYFGQVIHINFHVLVHIVQSEDILVFGLQFHPHVEGRKQVQKQLEIDPFGFYFPHLLLEQILDPRKQSMFPQILDLLKIPNLNRLQILPIQLRKQLLQICHLLGRIRLNIAHFILLELGLVLGPQASPVHFLPSYIFLRTAIVSHILKLIIIQMSFAGKRILVTGGNGYLGNYFAARFVQQQATVMALSRSGTKHEHPENDRIEWIKGNILEPTSLKDKINSADIIVHTIGTLFDTSVTKRAEPGQKGTYEQINRDTFSSLLSVIDQPKKILYISSASHPPFLQRYLSTKYEAEEMLQGSHHEGYSLRPGFIFSWKHRMWSIPIKVSIDMWNIVYPYLEKMTFIFSQKSGPGRLLREFKQGQNISLEELGNSVLELSLNGGKHKINEVPHLIDLSTKFTNQHQK